MHGIGAFGLSAFGFLFAVMSIQTMSAATYDCYQTRRIAADEGAK